ncbi:MAG: hypothetical protein ACK5MP_08230 [Nostocoides sp.]
MVLSKKNIATAAAAAGVLLTGGAGVAFAATNGSDGASGTASSAASYGQPGQGGQYGLQNGMGPGGNGGNCQDTVVTGDTRTKVEAAVKAEDSTISITQVRQDRDGSYDVIGTSGGSPVFYDVSEDLKTITKNTMTGGPIGAHGHGGPGGSDAQNGSSTSGSSSNPADANGSA